MTTRDTRDLSDLMVTSAGRVELDTGRDEPFMNFVHILYQNADPG